MAASVESFQLDTCACTGVDGDSQDTGYGKGGPQVEPTVSEPSSSPSFAAADSGDHSALSGTNAVMDVASSGKLLFNIWG